MKHEITPETPFGGMGVDSGWARDLFEQLIDNETGSIEWSKQVPELRDMATDGERLFVGSYPGTGEAQVNVLNLSTGQKQRSLGPYSNVSHVLVRAVMGDTLLTDGGCISLADGTEQWTTSIRGSIYAITHSTETVFYAGEVGIVAVDAESGEERWQGETETVVRSDPLNRGGRRRRPPVSAGAD